MAQLNTRLQLKYDSLQNWTTHNPELLSGEIAIVSLGNSHTTTSPDNGTHPILFKAGPGKFNALPFASALAADVYAWGKCSHVELDGQVLKFHNDNKQNPVHTVDLSVFVTQDELTEILTAYPTDNTAHNHTQGSGIKLDTSAGYTTGGTDGTVKLDLNIAMELIGSNIVIYDADDSTKTAIASMSASDFIKDGMIKSVELVDKKENESIATGQYLKITWNIDDVNGSDDDSTEDIVYLDVTTLVDVYTGGSNADITVSVSDQNVITATLNKQFALASALNNYKTKQDIVENKITSTAHVLSSLSQNENGNISYEVKELTPADIGAPTVEEMSNQNVVVLAEAQKYADSLHTTYSAEAGGGLKLNDKNEFAIDDSMTFIFYCGSATELV